MLPKHSPHLLPVVDLSTNDMPHLYVEKFEQWTDVDYQQEEPPHRHNFHEVLWFQSGSGRHQIDHQSITVHPGTTCLIVKGQVHVFEYAECLSGWMLCFTDDVFLDLPAREVHYAKALLHSDGITALAVNADVETTLNHLMPLILFEYQRELTWGKSAMLQHLLHSVLITLDRQRQHQQQHTTSVSTSLMVYRAFSDMLELHYTRQHAVSFYADALGLSVSRLTTIVRQITGKTTKDIIQERLLVEAKRHLHFTDMPISQISALLGYDDMFHFSKAFKQATTLSPQQYRNHLHKKP